VGGGGVGDIAVGGDGGGDGGSGGGGVDCGGGGSDGVDEDVGEVVELDRSGDGAGVVNVLLSTADVWDPPIKLYIFGSLLSFGILLGDSFSLSVQTLLSLPF